MEQKDSYEQIVKDFPLLYGEDFHFECGRGWIGLIRHLSETLYEIIDRSLDPDFYPIALQVKEKYGALRYYITSGTDEMYAHIEDATEMSQKTCERCGEPGEQDLSRVWIRTECQSCKTLRQQPPQ